MSEANSELGWEECVLRAMVVGFGGVVLGAFSVVAGVVGDYVTEQVAEYLWFVGPGLGLVVGALVGYRAPYSFASRLGVALAYGGLPLVGGIGCIVGGEIGDGSEAVSGLTIIPVAGVAVMASITGFFVGFSKSKRGES